MSIKLTLKELGLSDKEIEVYLTLLKKGKSTPAALSKITKINRGTVYNIAKSLQARGIIADDISGKACYFIPLPPSSLEQIINRPIRELQEKESIVKKAIDQLSLITAHTEYPVPKIRFVEEGDLENFLYENIQKWQDSVVSSDKVWWGTQDYTFLEQYGDFVDWYWKNPMSKGVKMFQVSNESLAEKEMHRKYSLIDRDIRFSRDVNFTSSVWVGGDYLIMVVTKQHPFYLVEVHDRTLAHNMREVFKKMWRESETNKKYEKNPTPADDSSN